MTGHGTKYGAVTVGASTARHGTVSSPQHTHTHTHTIRTHISTLQYNMSWAPGHCTCTACVGHGPLNTCLDGGTRRYRYPSSSLPEYPAWPALRAAPLSPHLTPPHTTSPPASNANFPSLSLFGFIAHPRPLARGTVQSAQFNSPRGSIKIWMCP